MQSTIITIVTILAGVILTLAGYFGPEDGGTLELIGFAVLGYGLLRTI